MGMAAAKDRALMRAQSKAMNADLNKKLVRSIQMGEARAKKAADRAREHLASTKRSVLIEISERVERTADKLFKTIQGNHKKIADNYLSLKAYAATCADKLKEYVAKGKGRNLSSLGDLLNSVTALAPVRAGKAEASVLAATSSSPSSVASPSRLTTLPPRSTLSSTSTWVSSPLCVAAGQWASASTSSCALSLPCRARVCSRSTRSPTRPATGCS